MKFQFSLFRRAGNIGKMIRRNFETVNHPFHRPGGIRRNRKILERDAPTFVIGETIENDLRHYTVEPAQIQLRQMIDLASHERAVITMGMAENVARNYAMIDAFTFQ